METDQKEGSCKWIDKSLFLARYGLPQFEAMTSDRSGRIDDRKHRKAWRMPLLLPLPNWKRAKGR